MAFPPTLLFRPYIMFLITLPRSLTPQNDPAKAVRTLCKAAHTHGHAYTDAWVSTARVLLQRLPDRSAEAASCLENAYRVATGVWLCVLNPPTGWQQVCACTS